MAVSFEAIGASTSSGQRSFSTSPACQDERSIRSNVVAAPPVHDPKAINKATQTDTRIVRPRAKDSQIQTSFEDRDLKKELRQLRYKYQQLRLKNMNLLNQLQRAKKKSQHRPLKQDQHCTRCRGIEHLEPRVRVLFEEQLQGSTHKITRWSQSTVSMAQCLLFKSPRCYKKLRNFLNLPSTSTIDRRSPKVSKKVSTVSYIETTRFL